MEAGRTPDDLETDEPVSIAGWSPQNHDGAYQGPVTLELALAKSINTVAAKVADEVGRDKVAQTAHRLGIVSTLNTDPAMALGTSQVTPLEMASAYSAFANGGMRANAYAVESIRTGSGQVVWRRRPDAPAQVIANPALSEMNRMLRQVVAQGTATRAAIPGFDIAGKTGTTSDNKDGWFCGYSGGFTACAWMGRDDSQPVAGLAGGGPPAQLWRAFMTGALPRAGAGPIPAGPPPAETTAPTPPPIPQIAPSPAEPAPETPRVPRPDELPPF